MKNLYLRLPLLILGFCLSAFIASAQVSSIAPGSWDNPATWSSGAAPLATETVTITHAVTLADGYTTGSPAVALSVTINTGGSLTFGNSTTARQLDVSDDFIINTGGAVNTSIDDATHVLNIAGDFVHNDGTFSAVNTDGELAVQFNGGGASNLSGAAATTFYTVSPTVSGTVVSQTNDITITNVFSIPNASTWNAGAQIIVSGITALGGGASGTLNITSASGTKQFASLSINTGAVWNNSGNSDVNFTQGIMMPNASTFNAGTGVHLFLTTPAQAVVSNFITIPHITVGTGVTLTNGDDNFGRNLVVADLDGAGTFAQSLGSSLEIQNTVTVNTMVATAAFNSVGYSGGNGQIVFSTNYHHLTLGGTGAKVLQTGTSVITGNFQIQGTATTTTVGTMTVGGGPGTFFFLAPGTSMDLAGFDFTVVPGTVTGIGFGGVPATLTLSGGGVKTFNGGVVMVNNSVWNDTGNGSVIFKAGIEVQTGGTFTGGSGVYTFDTNPQTLLGPGTYTIPNLAIDGITLTNNTTAPLTVSTSLEGTGTLTQVANSVLNIGGTSGLANIDADDAINQVNYTGAAQSVNGSFWELNLSGSGTKTFGAGTTSVLANLTLSGTANAVTGAGLTIGGDLLIGTGSTFSPDAFPLTVTGSTDVNGSVDILSATGTKVFNGLVTVAPGGSWSNSTGNSPVEFHNGITNNGTFSAGTGIHTFNTNNQALNGTFAIPNVTVTGVNLTNANSLDVPTDLAGTGSLIQSASATLILGGTSGISSIDASAAGNTVNYNGASQTVSGIDYVNLILSGSGAKTLQAGTSDVTGNLTLGGTATTATVASLAIGGNLTVGNGTTFDAAGFDLTVTGTTNVGSGSGGTLAISDAAGTKVFNGLVTVAASANWNNSGNSGVTFHNGINNGGTFTAGSGVYLFDTNTQSLTGTLAIPNVTVDGITLTNNNTLTVSTDLAGTGALAQANNATLNIGGASGITTLTASATGNTVNFTGVAQTVNANDYVNLGLSGSGVKTLQAATDNITGNFTVDGTASVTAVDALTIGGNVMLTSGTFVGGAFNHNVGGSWVNSGGTFTAGTGTITLNGTFQTIGGSAGTTFNNLTVTGSSSSNSSVNTTIGGTLTVDGSAALTINGFPFTVTGPTNLFGAMNISSVTGTKTFNGLLTVDASGLWTNTGNSPVTFHNGITNNGTFTAGSGVHTFETNAQALTGAFTIPNVAVNGVTLTNNNSLTVGTLLDGTGTLAQAASAVLDLGGGLSITTLDASAASNIVSYSGSGQTVRAIPYQDLTINQSGGEAALGGNTTVNGTLTLTSGNLNIGANNLLLGAAAVSSGGFSNATMIIASGGGEVRRTFTTTGSYDFPVGDNTGSLEYSPITVNYTTGSFSSAYVGVSVTDAKHPSNASVTNYLSRYWTVNQSGITGGVADVTATYSGDVVGTESSISSAHLSGVFNITTNPWVKGAILAGTVAMTNRTIVAGVPSYFTGVGGVNPTVTIDGGPFTICAGQSVVLNTTVTGDGPFTYLWTPSAGLSSPTVANPTATPSSTTNYEVTVTDANGFDVVADEDVNVNPLPVLNTTLTPTAICSGATFNYTPGSATPSTTFAWTRLAVAGIAEATASGNDNPAEVLTNTTNIPVSVTYAYTLTAAGCSGPAQNVVVSVLPAPVVTVPSDQNICHGGSTAPVNFTGVATVYEWTNNTAGIGIPPSGTGNIGVLPLTNLTASPITATITVTPRYTFASVTCDGPQQTFTITVNPTPTVSGVGDQELCAGLQTTAVNFSGTAGATFNWTNSNSGIGLPATGSGNIAAFTAVNVTGAPISATITVTPSLGICNGTPTAFTITVNPTPNVDPIANQVLCAGTNTTDILFTGTGTSYTWTNSATGIGLAANGTGDILAFNATNATVTPIVATIVVTPVFTAGSTCNGPTKIFTITVNPIPTVTAPTGQTICNGAMTTPVNFSGNGTSYSWVNDNLATNIPAGGTGDMIAYATTNGTNAPIGSVITVTPHYTFAGLTCDGAGQGFVIAVMPTPTIDPVTDQVVCNGDNTTTVTFSGDALGFNWTNDNTSIGLAASGSGPIPAFAAVNTGSSHAVANITVTPLYVSCTGTPEVFSITVNPTPSVVNPGNQSVCDGTSISAINFSGAATVFEWTNSAPGIGIPATGTGNIGAVPVTNGTSGPIIANFVVTPKYTVGAVTCTGATQSFSITVQPAPTVDPISNQTLCNGVSTTAVNFSGTANGYTWTNSAPSIGLPAAGAGNIAAFTAVNLTGAAVTATLEVTPLFNGCVGAATETFTITVNPTPSVNTIGNQVVCAGALTTDIIFGGTATTYNWTNSASGIGIAAAGSGDILSFTATNATLSPIIATIVVTPVFTSGATCTGSTKTFTITVNPTPSVTLPANQSICNGGNTLPVNFSGNATSYTWVNNTSGLGIPPSGIGNMIAYTTTNGGSSAVTATITITPHYTFAGVTCDGATQDFTITVQPTPTVDPITNQVVCNGDNTAAITLSGTADSYNWTNSNSSIGLAASGTGLSIPAFAGVNTGNLHATATITVTPMFGACAGAPTNFTITVNPTPQVNAVANQTVCNGTSISAINFGGTGTSYTWTNNQGGIGIGASGTGNIGATAVTNGGATQLVATFVVTPQYTFGSVTCPGPTKSFTITIEPAPTVAAVANQELCHGVTTTAVNFSGTANGFTWTNNTPSIGLPATGSGNISAFTAVNLTGAPVTATIVVTPTFNGCPGSTTSFTIKVNPTPNVNVVANQVVCAGAPTTDIIFGGTGTSYTWTNSAPTIGIAAAGSGDILSFNPTNATSSPIIATIVVTPVFTAGSTCLGATKTFTITVNPIPSVAAPSNQTVCNGSLTLPVNFSGTATSYDWTNNTAGLGIPASGTGNMIAYTATNGGASPVTATIIITPKYTFAGVTCNGTTQAFTITVQPTPTVNVITDQVVCNGTNTAAVTFGGTANGFSWTNNNTSIGLAASGTGLSLGAFAAVNNGTTHTTATITVTPLYGTCPGTPTTFTITVNPTPQVTAPANQIVCSGTSTAAVAFAGSGTTYDWTNNTPGLGIPASGTGDMIAYAVTNGGAGPVTATITITPKYTFGSVTCTGSDKTFTITVQPTPTVAGIGNQTLCNGTSTTAVTFSGTANGFSWTNSNPAIGLPGSGTGNIAAFTAVNVTGAPISGTITVTPLFGLCTGATQSFTITVNPTPNVNPIASQVVCAGSATTDILFAGTGSSYTWTNSAPSIGIAGSGTGDILSFTATNATANPIIATIVVTPVFTSGSTCSGSTKTFTITVNPTPSVTVPANQTICTGSNTIPVNFSGTATSYEWTNNNATFGIPGSGTGNMLGYAVTNGGSTQLTATITVTPRYTFAGVTCNGPTQDFTITVQPSPTVALVGNQNLCNGENTTAINFTGAATAFNWTNDNAGIGLAASGTGPIAAFTAVNNGGVHAIANITVTPVYGLCSGTPQTFTIRVNPTPNVNVIANQTVCDGSNISPVTFTGTGTTYTWTNNNPGIGIAASGTGNLGALPVTNGGGAQEIATFVVTPVYTFGLSTCTGPTKSFTITVNPTSTVTPIANQEVCNGTSTTAVAFGGTATGYTWTNNTPSIGLPASGTGDIAAFTAVNLTGAAVTATINVTPSFGACTGGNQSFTIKVNPSPNVVAIANQVLCAGATTTDVIFSGTGTSYTWTNSAPGIGIAGTGTGDILSFTATNGTANPIIATIVVTPVFTAGVTCTGPTKTFTITVNPTPSVTAPANQTICSGTSTLPVNFSGTATSYEWANNAPGLGIPATGTGNMPAFAVTNNGAMHVPATITITPKYTFAGVTCDGPTQTFTITVQPAPSVAAITSQALCNGVTTTAVSFTGTATTYNWTNDNTSIGLAGSGTGTIAAFTAVNTGSTHAIANITVTPMYGSCAGPTQSFTITVNHTPQVDAIANQTVCDGANIAAIAFSGSATTYEWTNTNPGIGIPATGTGDISALPVTNGGTFPATGTFVVTPRYTFASITCNGPTKTYSITVNPTPVASAVSNQTICNGSNTAAVIFGGTANGFTWTNDNTSIGLAATGSGNIGAFPAVNNGTSPATANIVVTPFYGSCAGSTITFSITVNPNPTFTATNNAPTICSGDAVSITFASPTAGHRINSLTPVYGGVTGGTVTGASVFTDGMTLSETLTNTTTAPIDVVYTFNVTTPLTSPACPLAPVNQQVVVRVQPSPDFTFANNALQICSGSKTDITLNTDRVGGQIRLQTVSYGAVSGTLANGALFNDGQKITEVLVNNTNAPVTVTYIFEAIVGLCGPSATKTAQVVVNPNPTFTVANNSPDICSGTLTNIAFTSLTSGHQINALAPVYGGVTGGSVTAGSTFSNGSVITEILTNNTTAPIDVVYTFNITTPSTTPSCPVLVTNQVVVVRVQPSPVFTFTNNAASICSGSQANITLNTDRVGAQVRIANINYGGVTGTLSNGVVFNNGQHLSEVLVNNTTGPLTVAYTFEAVIGSCTPSATQTVQVVVNPNPSFTVANNSPNICSGTPTNIVFASPTAGHSINVTDVNYGLVTGGLVSIGNTFTDGVVLAEALTNGTDNPIDVVYKFNVTTSATPSCPLVPSEQVVTVRVQPASAFSISNTALRFCSGNQTNIQLTSSVSNAQIRLANVAYNGVSGTLSPGALYNNGQQIREVLTNTTSAPVTVVYTFEAVVGGCIPSAQQTASVIVDPIPNLATNLNLQELCELQIPTIGLTNPNGVSGTAYIWTIATTNVDGAINQPTPSPAASINTVLELSSGSIGTITYTVRASANGCQSAPESIQLTVRLQPTVSVPPNLPVCEPTSITLDGEIGGGATSALWSVITGAGSLSSTNVVSGLPIQADAVYAVNSADVASSVTMRLTTNDPDGPSGLCQAVSADYTIPINRSAKVSAGPDLIQCEDLVSIQLQGSTAYAPNGTTWTLVTGAGTFSNAGSPTSDYTFVNPGEVDQTVTLKITATDPDAGGPCMDVEDIMTLTINPLPVVSFVGFPSPAAMAENQLPITLTGNERGGVFSISPTTSLIGATTPNPTDQVSFNPGIVTLGPNTVTYTFTDEEGCTNTDSQLVIINPVTDVDFIIQGAKLTALQEWEVCADQGKLKLLGNPLVGNGFPPETRFHLSPDFPNGGLRFNNVINIVFESGDWYIDTDGAVSDTYMVRYTFKNQFNAITYKEYAVHLFASPVASINVDNSCVKDVIQFNDASTLPSTPFGATIDKWRWDFDDQSFSDVQNPSHGYLQPRYYDIGLIATTNQGCSGTAAKQIRVGDEPTVVFDWSALCNNERTKFVDGSSAGISNIISYQWDFGDGTTIIGAPNGPITGGGSTIGTFNRPEHRYLVDGRYTAKLTIRTDDGCENSLAQQVNIFPYITVTPSATAAYTQGFETLQNGWSAEALWKEKGINQNDSARYSWMRGTPNGLTIKSAASGANAWWTGRRVTVDPFGNNNPRYTNPDTYFKSESSAVNGPCFNLTGLERPMVALDYWSDSELSRDGAVLQYSTDGGFTWELVGPLPGSSIDQGINWYNRLSIVGRPGNQEIAGDYGWSGRTEGWKNARYNLDMVDPSRRDQVRLRIAFGSEDDNDDAVRGFDGFAFDNVFVGDKKKNVLVEHFTSNDNGAGIIDNQINLLYDDQIATRAAYGGKSDFYNVQYHMASNLPNPLNLANQIDPSSRAAFMSVSAPPTTIMDGLRNAKFTGIYTEINKIEVDRRALEDPAFLMTLDTTAVDPATPKAISKITPVITLTAQRAFTTPLLLNVALIETVGNNRNVLRKLLYGPDGLTINNSVAAGEVLIRDKGVCDINVFTANPTGLTMIAFVQDKITKEIYQVVAMKVKKKIGDEPTGLEEEPDQETELLKQVTIYPNPANTEYHFGIPAKMAATGDAFTWKMADQRGVIVRGGDFSQSINGQIGVDVQNLAAGMYIIGIEGPNKAVSYHKLMVIHHH